MKREQDHDQESFDTKGQLPTVMESIRSGSMAPMMPIPSNDEEKMSLFWRVFGGTILSIGALIGVTLYNSMMSSISELRSELNRLNEARAELIKKDEFNTRLSAYIDQIRTLQTQDNSQTALLTGYKTEFDGIKEKLNRYAIDIDALRKDNSTAIEGLKKDVIAIEAMKERLGTAVLELKSVQTDTAKLRSEIDRNQVADQERKARRDEQYKEFDKAIKDLQLSLQQLQVKLARIEGLSEQTKPMTAPLTVVPPEPKRTRAIAKPVDRTERMEPTGPEIAPTPRLLTPPLKRD
ncbi:MAG: coiled-coil domain-containing protein [Gemmataceae bacterium]